MADLLQILSSNYVAAGSLSAAPGKKYVNVDPALFEGTWRGKYADGKAFSVSVTNVSGFRAQAKYESGGTVKYQNVLIAGDNSFRVGDSKFTLTRPGTAQVKTVMAGANGSSSLETAYAKQNG
jgi:hypothetical protein